MADKPIVFCSSASEFFTDGENVRAVDYSGGFKIERVMSRHHFLASVANARRCVASWASAELPLGRGDEE